jgi:galactokinase
VNGGVAVRVEKEFEQRFGVRPDYLARAPGRVNLIGDHTDYNDGFVLPMAIDRAVWMAFRARQDRRVVAYSLDFAESTDFDLSTALEHRPGWQEYVRGVAWVLSSDDTMSAAHRSLTGWEGVVGGDAPLGAGLSSSAALELAVARTFAAVSGKPWDPVAMARAAQRAEHEWVGVNCGIMDPLISATGVEGSAVLIDCRSLERSAVRLPHSVAVVVLDTATRRGLVDSAYNERRRQCERAAAFFQVPALRDVDVSTFAAREGELDDVTRKRARHVITENTRTLAAARALAAGDVERVGTLMNESHASLRDDFEVSREELDVMVSLARGHDACYGARMTGAGFGGCAVALVPRDAADAFVRETASGYARATGLTPTVYVCAASSGATIDTISPH